MGQGGSMAYRAFCKPSLPHRSRTAPVDAVGLPKIRAFASMPLGRLPGSGWSQPLLSAPLSELGLMVVSRLLGAGTGSSGMSDPGYETTSRGPRTGSLPFPRGGGNPFFTAILRSAFVRIRRFVWWSQVKPPTGHRKQAIQSTPLRRLPCVLAVYLLQFGTRGIK